MIDDDGQIKYVMTIRRQVRMLLPLIAKNSILTALCWIILENFDFSFFLMISIFFLIDVLPTLIIHIQYYCFSKDIEITVDLLNKTVEYNKKEDRFIIGFAEVTEINYYVAFVKPTGAHSFGEYRYIELVVPNTQNILITCLMNENIELRIPNQLKKPLNKIGKTFPLIKSN